MPGQQLIRWLLTAAPTLAASSTTTSIAITAVAVAPTLTTTDSK